MARTTAARATLPLLSMCAVFSCVQTMVWLPVFGFLTCPQMLIHVIVHGGCTDTVRESALETDSGKKKKEEGKKIKKSLAAPGIRTRFSIAPGFSVEGSSN